MFYCCVLRSEQSDQRYVGSCEDVADRLYRHNSGQSKTTKSGIPWRLIHTEALARERYDKIGRGRDELDKLQ